MLTGQASFHANKHPSALRLPVTQLEALSLYVRASLHVILKSHIMITKPAVVIHMLLWEWIRGGEHTIIIILIIFLSEFSPMEHF